MTEFIEIEKREFLPAERSQPTTILALISKLAADPAVDVGKLQALLDMQRQLEGDQARIAFDAAMNAAQAEIQPVARTAENSQTRSFYAKLEDVDQAIRPIYLKHGFSLSFSTIEPLTTSNVRLECRVSRAGHTERYYREAAPDTHGPKGAATKTPLHGAASTETFLRRYLTCGIFNVVFAGLDRDGNRENYLEPETGEVISAEEVKEISSALKPAGVTIEMFCDRWKVTGIPELPRPRFVQCMNELRRRAQQRKERAA